MAVTTNKGQLLNPLSSSRSGGLIPSANVIVNVASWADALEPRRTPVLARVGKGSAVDQIKVEWGQSYHAAISGTVAANVGATDTTITVSTSEGNLIQPWFVLELIDWADAAKTRLDYSTREEVIVTSVSTDTVTVKRTKAITNTADSNYPGIAVGTSSMPTHTSGALWAVCGVAMPYNTDFAYSPFVRGDRLFNFPQRYFGMVGADIAARNTPSYETAGDQMLKDLEEQTMLQKWYLERSIVSGGRLEGDAATINPASNTSNPYKMGGIDWFITNHSGRVVNMSGKTLSAYDLEAILRDMYKEVDDGGAKTLLMGPDTASIFDTLINPIRQATVTDTKLNLVVDQIKFRWGTLEIMPTQHMPEGSILFVDFKDISLHPYKGCSWSTKTIATDGPYDKIAIWGDYTLKVDRVLRMGKIYNFDLNLNNYPRREFF